jgi:uncharacterized protein
MAPIMEEIIISIISDTHGLVRPEVLNEFRGSDFIFHAGDIGSPNVLDALKSVAPVIAVRGNTDAGPWAERLNRSETAKISRMLFHVLHDISAIDLDPAAAGINMIISGHSHMPEISKLNGIYYLNPGSAGPGRFTLPVTAARVYIRNGELKPEIIYLD